MKNGKIVSVPSRGVRYLNVVKCFIDFFTFRFRPLTGSKVSELLVSTYELKQRLFPSPHGE